MIKDRFKRSVMDDYFIKKFKVDLLIQTRSYGSSTEKMMMMKLPILPCAENLELVLSTAPKTSDNTDKDSKNRKRSH